VKNDLLAATIPIDGYARPILFNDGALIGLIVLPANAVERLEKSGLVAGHLSNTVYSDCVHVFASTGDGLPQAFLVAERGGDEMLGQTRSVMFLPQCVGNPRAPVLSKRPVTHVRYHRRAEQKYEECQHNQVPPIPGHAVLPFFRV